MGFKISIKKALFIIGSTIILAGCSNIGKNNNKSKSPFKNDPVMECRRHCNMNFSACIDTANSPEARSECISTRQACLGGC